MREWLLSQFPDHHTYVEAFGGAATILLNKNPSDVEVYNDLEYSVFNLMRVLRDHHDELLLRVRQLKYEKETYLLHRNLYLSDEFMQLPIVEQAVTTLVTKRMSRGGLCGTFSRSDRTLKNGVNAEIHAWLTTVHDLLPEIAGRLKDVVILNLDAIAVLNQFDGPHTLFYLDPPYVTCSRVFKKAYRQEMTDEDHRQLAMAVRKLQGKVILSGYPSTIYNELYGDWACCSRNIPNHSSHGTTKNLQTECVWKNF